jgi:DNA-binding transcriptional regulator LsrR (DeoR family)
MTGVVGDVSSNSVELVRRVTVASGGQAYPIYAPLVVSDPDTADALRKEPALAQAIERFGTITVAAIAVGSWDPPNSQLYDSLSADERDDLRRIGVVGEICSTLLDAGGEVVGEFGRRSIAVPSAQLREIPTTVVVAGGKTKAVAIRAVLRGGFASALVTDSEVARELLEQT